MKIIIIGTACSGKTTTVRWIKKHTEHSVSEIEESMIVLNNGKIPNGDLRRKLTEIVFKDLIKEDKIFFVNTDYFLLSELEELKSSGYKIYILKVSPELQIQRNINRIKEENYPDSSKWFVDMFDYIAEVENFNLVDLTVDASQPTEQIAKEILAER